MLKSIHPIGIKCKACDRGLDQEDFDGELCTLCLEVVTSINKNLYDSIEAEALGLDEIVGGGDPYDEE